MKNKTAKFTESLRICVKKAFTVKSSKNATLISNSAKISFVQSTWHHAEV